MAAEGLEREGKVEKSGVSAAERRRIVTKGRNGELFSLDRPRMGVHISIFPSHEESYHGMVLIRRLFPRLRHHSLSCLAPLAKSGVFGWNALHGILVGRPDRSP